MTYWAYGLPYGLNVKGLPGYCTTLAQNSCQRYHRLHCSHWCTTPRGPPVTRLFSAGLLQHDMVERFLLHYFAMSAHTYTRGTWTTPEAASPDRDVGSTDYVAAGVVTAPTYLKWMLLYEEPDSRTACGRHIIMRQAYTRWSADRIACREGGWCTESPASESCAGRTAHYAPSLACLCTQVWLAKALPRDWLDPSTSAVVVEDATTRYGRVSFRLKASLGLSCVAEAKCTADGCPVSACSDKPQS